MTMTDERPALNDRRERLGLSLAACARSGQIRYQRLWKFFAYESDLTEDEMQRLRSVLSGGSDGGVSDGDVSEGAAG